jgi:hypothetical protein
MNLLETIGAASKGRLLSKAQQTLSEPVKAVIATGKKASVTIRLDLEPGAEEGVIHVSGQVIPKIPEKTLASTSFYADENGGLHKEDPRQPEFPSVVESADAVNQ